MQITKNIAIEEYTYDLPDSKIAKYPLGQRDKSKLLIYNKGKISEDKFNNIALHLPKNSLLVSNNTKVIRARIELFKETGARIEVFCLEPFAPSDYNVSFAQTKKCEWFCIVGNLKKWKQGSLSKQVEIDKHKTLLTATRIRSHGEAHIIEFSWDNENLTFSEILESMGNIPIPPYLNRKSEESDNNRYQTIYSKHKGSVAAPTAGLHFTETVFNTLKSRNINRHEVTLHVGAGTFRPVKTKTIGEHEMHYEQFIITKDTIPNILKNIGNITAVGTTTVRTLESLYWLGVKLLDKRIENNSFVLHQWEAYNLSQNIKASDALNYLQQHINSLQVDYISASTGIMIAPGYKLKITNQVITNFHQPQSTLLVLIGSIIGENWHELYKHALNNNFRFLSYGDSCLIMP